MDQSNLTGYELLKKDRAERKSILDKIQQQLAKIEVDNAKLEILTDPLSPDSLVVQVRRKY